jgi:hypothetical protein
MELMKPLNMLATMTTMGEVRPTYHRVHCEVNIIQQSGDLVVTLTVFTAFVDVNGERHTVFFVVVIIFKLKQLSNFLLVYAKLIDVCIVFFFYVFGIFEIALTTFPEWRRISFPVTIGNVSNPEFKLEILIELIDIEVPIVFCFGISIIKNVKTIYSLPVCGANFNA